MPTGNSDSTFATARAHLVTRLTRSMESGLDDASFLEMALETYEHQLRWNQPYASYARSMGIGSVSEWWEIPTVVTDVFKTSGIPVVCGSPTLARHRFRTSGTTGEERGYHFFHSLDLYESSITLAWKELGLPSMAPLFLAPRASDWPESSLGHMMHVLESSLLSDRLHQGGSSHFVSADGKLDLEGLSRTLDGRSEPVLLCGTALAYLNLFEELCAAGRQIELPPGSNAFETGGYKGVKRELSKKSFYEMFEQHLCLKPEAIINEYGMTELSSQFYARSLDAPHQGPSWTRVRIVDPETKMEVAQGERGYIQVWDLANIDSVVAIETQDLAIRRPNGTFELVGRDPAAAARGCSRAADELMRGPFV